VSLPSTTGGSTYARGPNPVRSRTRLKGYSGAVSAVLPTGCGLAAWREATLCPGYGGAGGAAMTRLSLSALVKYQVA
jgi:hypothetical protein